MERTILVGVFLVLFIGSLVHGTFVASQLKIKAGSSKQLQVAELQSLLNSRARDIFEAGKAALTKQEWQQQHSAVTEFAEGGKAAQNATDALAHGSCPAVVTAVRPREPQHLQHY